MLTTWPARLGETLPNPDRYDFTRLDKDEDADTNRVFSPNHMSLTQARENYRLLGLARSGLDSIFTHHSLKSFETTRGLIASNKATVWLKRKLRAETRRTG
jgi:hypothetical protein